MNECVVTECLERAHARHLCQSHYKVWQRKGHVTGADENAGDLIGTNAPLVCVCQQPQPDAIGMCTRCGRLVVTFARANRHRYRETYPVEWQRAMEMELGGEPDEQYEVALQCLSETL